MEFFDLAGPMAVGSRLRWLEEQITAEAAGIYAAYGRDFNPKWFPVFYMLARGPAAAADVAAAIGHSHVSVGKIVKELRAAGLIRVSADRADKRRSVLTLSPAGLRLSKALTAQYDDVATAVEELRRESRHDLWRALDEWQRLLGERGLSARVRGARARREAADVRIVPYQPKYRRDFERLNLEWITTHFAVEEPDRRALRDPKKYILDSGGFILVALHRGKAVGVCALLKMDDRTFELAKMAVDPKSRGLAIGHRLGRAALDRARKAGAKSVYLESNTKLVPAVALYRKLGFVEVKGRPTPYARCNIQMQVEVRRE